MRRYQNARNGGPDEWPLLPAYIGFANNHSPLLESLGS